MLFMLNGVKKLKEGSGRMAIIQNGSSLFTGDAPEIRCYLTHEDLVEVIVQLLTDLFYIIGNLNNVYTYDIIKIRKKHNNLDSKIYAY